MFKRSFVLIVGAFLLVLASLYFLEFHKDPLPQSAGLLNKAMPPLDLPLLQETGKGSESPQPAESFEQQSPHRLTPQNFERKKVILHFFASWCQHCRKEHPVIKALATHPGVILYGVSIHDKRKDALEWLKEEGDPYDLIGFDEKGETGITWGVMATPQTFVIDEKGQIIYQYSGSLTEERFANDLLPLL